MNTHLPRRLAGLLATLGLAAIIVGFPLLLLAIGANPIPDTIPNWTEAKNLLLSPDDGTLALGALQIVAWAAWAFMTLTLLVEAAAQLHGVRAPRLPGLGVPQNAARHLVATAALLFIAAPMTAQVASAAPAAAGPTVATSWQHATSATEQTATTQETPAKKTGPRTIRHTVQPGETLWSIAERHFGDGSRYRELADLNRAVVGAKPGFLKPGWVLVLPVPNDRPGDPGTVYVVQPGDSLSSIAHDSLGDPDRWRDIYHASTDVTQPDGVRLTDPDQIDVGWTVNIPNNDSGNRPAAPTRPAPHTPPGTTTPRDETPEPVRSPSAVSAPTATGSPVHDAGSSTAADDVGDSDDSILGAPWLLADLTGGGVLLSGALFLALNTRRRAQFRARRPGRAIAVPAPELAPVEMTISATGAPAAATVEFTDDALRRLAAKAGADRTPMPALAAVELGEGRLTLHLSAPAQLETPWEDGAGDGMHWSLPTDVAPDEIGPGPGHAEAPYPLLVTIGEADTGELWLLNAEELGTLTIGGDPTYGRDFARHLAAQLAVNPWSNSVHVDCVGVAEEASAMGERIRYHDPGEAGSSVTAEVLADAVAMVDRSAGHHTDVSTGRTGQIDDDTWPARMLLLDAAEEPQGLEQLLGLVTDHIGRSGTSVVVTGDRENTPGSVLRMTSNGRIVLDQVGLDLIAVGLTSDETRGCALVYAQSENLEDVEIPVDDTAEDGWEAYANAAGGLRHQHTLPRSTPPEDIDEPVESILDRDDVDYLREGAAVSEDLAALAPKVPVRFRAEVEDADPTLDQDVADWFNPDTDRPRLNLLGPITVRAHGKALAKRKAYFTEMLAYLALRRRHGVTPAELADSFGLEPAKARTYINTLRGWLGANPATGEPHLPHADKAPAAKTRGVNVYQVDNGLLIDADLFKRLRVRGEARGGRDGLRDLIKALELVTGRPFDQQREGGWAWLHEGERHDHYATIAIADVAFLVTTACLAQGSLTQARAAAEIAVFAAPDEEATRLCLARVTEAEGDQQEAERILREDVCNRSDDADAPTDLSERTETILRNHQWLAS